MRDHAGSGTEVFDGLRGAAILLVLLYHTWLFSWFTPALTVLGVALPVDVPPRVGYLGVDLFFVISGFVLFYPHAIHAVHGGRVQTVADFTYRRFIKIVPSYALALAVTAIAALPLFPSRTALLAALVQHAAFVQNFYADGFGFTNSVFWSLAIEVQFYLLFPALAWAFRRQPLVVAGAMVVAALGYRYQTGACCLLVETVTRQLPAYLDLFALGMLAAYLVVRLRTNVAALDRLRPFGAPVAAACALLAFLVLQSANGVQYDPGGRERWDILGRTLFGGALAAFAVCSCFSQRWWRRIVANPLLVFFSTISYNLYLWHTLVMIWAFKHGIPKAATPNPFDDDRWKFAYICLGWSVSIGIATAITYFIERPLLSTVKPQRFAFNWHSVSRAGSADVVALEARPGDTAERKPLGDRRPARRPKTRT